MGTIKKSATTFTFSLHAGIRKVLKESVASLTDLDQPSPQEISQHATEFFVLNAPLLRKENELFPRNEIMTSKWDSWGKFPAIFQPPKLTPPERPHNSAALDAFRRSLRENYGVKG